MDIVATVKIADYNMEWFFYDNDERPDQMRPYSSESGEIADWEKQRQDFEGLGKEVATFHRANKEYSYPLRLLEQMKETNKPMYARNLKTSHREWNELSVIELKGKDHK